MMTQNQIRFLEAQESIRANKAREQENYRANKAKEDETNRSNLVNEKLAQEKLDYEKYGKDILGQSVRTIKAGMSDTIGAVNNNAAEKGKSIGYAPSTNRSTGKTLPAPSIGGLDIFDKATKDWESMSQSEFKALYTKYKNGELSLNDMASRKLEQLAKLRKVV